jgi:hypothetical protein
MTTQLNNPSLLFVDPDSDPLASRGVGVRGLDAGLMVLLRRYLQAGGLLQSLLKVKVARTGASQDVDLPDMMGCYEILEDGVRFIPYFPFEPGLPYQARFDPRPLGRPEFSDTLTLDFSLPPGPRATIPQVTGIFPSSDQLPENLLRFYICFSEAMQHGCARTVISILGPDDEPVLDALYRAPVELWDRSMRRLTVLLDPGRLKRGVGPNRELGPPLKAGRMYTLAVGGGMNSSSGVQLYETVCKRFRVTEPLREAIVIDQWAIAPPCADTRQPLTLTFPRPLDWGLLSHAIAVESTHGQSIVGRIAIDQCERRWSFTPTSPWTSVSHRIRVASGLEDVCGNSVAAAFDRSLRSGGEVAFEAAHRSIPFRPIERAAASKLVYSAFSSSLT